MSAHQMLKSLLTPILIVVIKVGQSVKEKHMHIIDSIIINVILIHLENISLRCKDGDAIEGTNECLEPDSICLVKRVGMCVVYTFFILNSIYI